MKFVEKDRLSDEAILAYLDTQDGLEDLIPAVITEVSGQQAEAILSGGRKITLPWQGLSWARAFISHDRQSHAPKAAADVLAPGMHVLVRPAAGEWRLGQIPGVSGAIVAINPKDGACAGLSRWLQFCHDPV